MRNRTLSLLIALFLFFLPACRSDDTPVQEPEQDSDISLDDAAYDDDPDTLRVVLPATGRTLDPVAATDAASAVFVYAVYDRLVDYGSSMDAGLPVANPDDIVPSLAREWVVSPDGLEYTFFLDQSARFASGDVVDADSVLFSLARIRDSSTASFLFALSNIETMEKVDDSTFRLYLSKPCPILLGLLQMHLFSIVNPAELEGMGSAEQYLETTPAGSGPYVIDRWEENEIHLSARQDYWRPVAPVPNVLVQVVPEYGERYLLAETEQVDIITELPTRGLAALGARENLNINVYNSNFISYIVFNTNAEPFHDVRVRQALSYAIPYEGIVDSITSRHAVRLHHVLPSIMPGYLETFEDAYTFQPQTARSMLDEAGFPSRSLSFELLINSSLEDQVQVARIFQDSLARLSVQVQIVELNPTEYTERLKTGDFQVAVGNYTAYVNDPGYLFGNTLHTLGEYNYGSYSSSEVDALWEAAESSDDYEARMQNYALAQEIVRRDAPVAVMYEGHNIVVVNDRTIDSYLHYPDGALRFYYISKKQS